VAAARYWPHVVPKAAIVSLRSAVGEAAIGVMGIPTSKRLRTQVDFQQVRTEGQRILCGPFILQGRLGSTRTRRFGVIASRRVGNAVKRNRGKRLLREIFRTHEAQLPEGLELVAVLRSGYDRHSYADLERRFVKACAQMHSRVGGNT